MARGVTIEIQGLKQVQKFFGELPRHVIVETDAEMADAANTMVNRAVADVPVDTGRLRNAITFKRIKELVYEVVAATDYAAFVEFGTITLVKAPAEYAAYAMQFKGRGIKKTGGMRARPYLLPQIPVVQMQLNKNLNEMIKRFAA
jgi:hypothetical protein